MALWPCLVLLQASQGLASPVPRVPPPGSVVGRVLTPGGVSSYRRAGQSGRPRGSPRSHQPSRRSTSHCLCSAWSLLSSARPGNGSGSSCSGRSSASGSSQAEGPVWIHAVNLYWYPLIRMSALLIESSTGFSGESLHALRRCLINSRSFSSHVVELQLSAGLS